MFFSARPPLSPLAPGPRAGSAAAPRRAAGGDCEVLPDAGKGGGVQAHYRGTYVCVCAPLCTATVYLRKSDRSSSGKEYHVRHVSEPLYTAVFYKKSSINTTEEILPEISGGGFFCQFHTATAVRVRYTGQRKIMKRSRNEQVKPLF